MSKEALVNAQGKASVTIVANVAAVKFQVSTDGATSHAAAVAACAAATALCDVIKAAATVENLRVEPTVQKVYTRVTTGDTHKNVFECYRAFCTICFEIHDVAKLSALTDLALGSGNLVTLHGIEFSLDENTKLEKSMEMVKLATQRALAQVNVVATALGVRTERVATAVSNTHASQLSSSSYRSGGLVTESCSSSSKNSSTEITSIPLAGCVIVSASVDLSCTVVKWE